MATAAVQFSDLFETLNTHFTDACMRRAEDRVSWFEVIKGEDRSAAPETSPLSGFAE
jgi:hypothetical protein